MDNKKEDFSKLFPLNKKENSLSRIFKKMEFFLKNLSSNKTTSRFPGVYNKETFYKLEKKYNKIPKKSRLNDKFLNQFISDFFSGVPRWRSPLLLHNVGSPVNIYSSAIYGLALDENIYNINSGLAGNALASEQIIVRLLAKLAKIKKPVAGFFTFGGTATNFYALKMGLKKSAPLSGKEGSPRKTKTFITEDSHYSHKVCADWLGLGTDNVITMKINPDRQTNLKEAEKQLRKVLDKNRKIASIILNGGTTYDHVVDPILDFVKLRDRLRKEYKLDYTPHLHVDTVIGWSWLFFNEYDFKKNPLKIEKETLNLIKKQNRKIAQLKYADSWGIDFHKGIGGCPVDSSIVIFNNKQDLKYISKKFGDKVRMAQIAEEFCFSSPADFTIETSRSGGAPLSALMSLYSLGIEGFQKRLANLVHFNKELKKELNANSEFEILNPYSLGFVTMLRIFPKELIGKRLGSKEINKINRYMKEFFNWDTKNRISKLKGVEYSFSGGYMKKNNIEISGIKIYPVSPYFNEKIVKEIIKTLKTQKQKFDKNVWPKIKNN